jgi:ribonuclease BN (tRNA processing enzyme)
MHKCSKRKLIAAVMALGVATLSTSVMADKSRDSEVEGSLSVMVLGSGGPMAVSNGRASAGYLIFTDGKPRILMDVGGGTFKSLAMSGTVIPKLDTILLSHLHIDHTADMSAMVKTIYFHARGAGIARTAPINIYGPDANSIKDSNYFPGTSVHQYPATSEYAADHYAMPNGAERYLYAFAQAIDTTPAGDHGEFKWTATDLPAAPMAPPAGPGLPPTPAPVHTVLAEDGTGATYTDGAACAASGRDDCLVIKSIGVVHGPVPAVGYRIEYKGHSIVYSGDTSSKTNNMVTLAQGADLLIYDTSILDVAPSPVFQALHTTPARMGAVAAAAGVKTLVLSHLTPITEPNLAAVKAEIATEFSGHIRAARDLKVYNLDDSDRYKHHGDDD